MTPATSVTALAVRSSQATSSPVALEKNREDRAADEPTGGFEYLLSLFQITELPKESAPQFQQLTPTDTPEIQMPAAQDWPFFNPIAVAPALPENVVSSLHAVAPAPMGSQSGTSEAGSRIEPAPSDKLPVTQTYPNDFQQASVAVMAKVSSAANTALNGAVSSPAEQHSVKHFPPTILAAVNATKTDALPVVPRSDEDASKRGGTAAAPAAGQPSPWTDAHYVTGVGASAEPTDSTLRKQATVLPSTLRDWVSNTVGGDLQQAQFTLEAWGEEPVQVSISLHGDQAQVVFGCDQASSRATLESSVIELEKLLLDQGLLLSEVTVGPRSERDPGQQEPRNSPHFNVLLPAKPDSLAVAPVGVNTERIQAGSIRAGRVLDLFV